MAKIIRFPDRRERHRRAQARRKEQRTPRQGAGANNPQARRRPFASGRAGARSKLHPATGFIILAVVLVIGGLFSTIAGLPGRMFEALGNAAVTVRDSVAGRAPARAGSAAGMARGRVSRVIDGDSLVVNGVEVRLHGIDAPELRQRCKTAGGAPYPCGRRAKAYLARLTRGKTVRCRRVTTDRYGRMVAICEADGADIGRQMVRAGWAVAYVRYSRAYVADERAARQARAGMHAGRFVPPAVWRKAHRRH